MTAWFSRFTHKPAGSPTLFGPLEWRVLEALWERGTPAAVRDLRSSFPDTAYTTLMTTLDRLYRKNVLTRTKSGRAFLYVPRQTRAELDSAAAANALRVAIDGDGAALRPLMSFFVEAVDDRNHQLLDELESLIRARRAGREMKRS
jgi:predicted transcriptional regulator